MNAGKGEVYTFTLLSILIIKTFIFGEFEIHGRAGSLSEPEPK